MPIQEDTQGIIDISSAAIATIVSQAVNQSYGVVGMSSKNLVGGIAQLLTRDNRRGIDVTVTGDQIVIDIYVIVQHGVRIRTVAESIQQTVKFHVEQALGLPVHAVNIYVQGLRMTDVS